MTIEARYSPDDDKIRLYPSSRLDKETYTRVKDAGYGWAPKQECFYAVWTPHREDLALELAGEIDDEDTSLVDRAEQRAERFEDYSERRAEDATRARDAVSRIADGIPLGQPILIGHHSERHARRDAEKIENGMRRAVKMWETSQYWQQRAAGALRHAKYLERPDVRHRRIKGLQADARKQEKIRDTAALFTKLWNADGLTYDRARAIASRDRVSKCFTLAEYPREAPASQYEGMKDLWSALEGIITPEQAREIAVRVHARTIEHAERWLSHLTHRIEYEQAMLGESGGIAADQFNIEVGGRILRRGEWLVVTKVNRQGGRINSVSIIGRFAGVVPIEEVKDYKAPSADDAAKVKAVTKQPPLCNFRSEGCIEMTTAEWKEKSKYSDALAVRGFDANGVYHWRNEKDAPIVYRHRSRYFLGSHRDGDGTKVVPVFLTDAKDTEPPKAPKVEPVSIPREFSRDYIKPTASYEREEKQPNEFEQMRDALRSGVAVQVVSAPQLFPTPADLARLMVQLAQIGPGEDVLEPSAGTGVLADAILADEPDARLQLVEINHTLAEALAKRFNHVLQGDFLECTPDQLGLFDAVVMNPPFAPSAADIAHIQHAAKFLKPGGRLVAICANGPRQNDKLRPMVEDNGGEWHDLPAGTFKDSGTNVNTAMLVYTADALVTA
jgi:phospholipid N-methyltransferase